MNPSLQDSDIIIDSRLLREVTRLRLRSWIVIGPIIVAIAALVQLCLLPQSYTATVSVSVQQSQGASSTLALLTGTGGPSRKYIGILHSRVLAAKVEHKVHLQSFYHIATERRAVDLLMHSIRPEESATDGLLMVNVTLTGPARFAPDPQHRRDRVKQMVADVANESIAQLSDYYATSDNDRDSVLLNAAADELHRARAEYDQSSARIRGFIADMSKTSDMDPPSPTADAASAVPAGLTGLADEAERVQAEIRGAEAAQEARQAGMNRQLNTLNAMPSDDPFLAIARDNVTRIRTALRTLTEVDQLSDTNPSVVATRERLRIAQQQLQREQEGYRTGLTTESVLATSRLESLRARRNSLLASLRHAQRGLPRHRERSIALIELEKEQEIKLAALKAIEEKAADVRLTSVSSKSRLSVVDSAIAPEGGEPTISRALLMGVALTSALFFPVLARDYLRQSRREIPPTDHPPADAQAIVSRSEEPVQNGTKTSHTQS